MTDQPPYNGVTPGPGVGRLAFWAAAGVAMVTVYPARGAVKPIPSNNSKIRQDRSLFCPIMSVKPKASAAHTLLPNKSAGTKPRGTTENFPVSHWVLGTLPGCSSCPAGPVAAGRQAVGRISAHRLAWKGGTKGPAVVGLGCPQRRRSMCVEIQGLLGSGPGDGLGHGLVGGGHGGTRRHEPDFQYPVGQSGAGGRRGYRPDQPGPVPEERCGSVG